MRVTLLVGLTVLALAGSAPAAPPGAIVELQEHIRKVIDTAEPTVVALVVSHSPDYPAQSAAERLGGILGEYFPRQQPAVLGRDARDPLDLSDVRNIPNHGYATGLIIDSAGLILTNYHAIQGARKIYVRWTQGDGRYANVHAYDARSDLAVLRMINPPARLPVVRVADVRSTDDLRGRKANVYRGHGSSQWVTHSRQASPMAARVRRGV
jgi:serine protease Do